MRTSLGLVVILGCVEPSAMAAAQMAEPLTIHNVTVQASTSTLTITGVGFGNEPVVTVDGQPVTVAHGSDVDAQGNGVAKEQRVYQLVRQPMPIVDRVFQIEFLDAGVEAFAFTFG